MLAYVKEVQRKEIRAGLDCVKHQDMAGTYIGDDHKEYFSGQAALKAGYQRRPQAGRKIGRETLS